MEHIQDRFNGLGTTIDGSLVIDRQVGEALWREIRQRVADFEDRFSRFRPTSELSQLNARAGEAVRVSPEMLSLLRQARTIWDQTGGIVDPLIGNDLVAAGYHRSFDQLQQSPAPKNRPARVDLVFGNVEISDDGLVTLPAQTMLDLGGIGKGYLADQLAAFISEHTKDFWISLGGDIFVSGRMPDGKPWPIAIQDQQHLDRDALVVQLPYASYGIATSSTQARRGTANGKTWHHLIDPRTNEPAVTNLLGATVIAPTTLQADVAAKTVVIRGQESGHPWLKEQDRHLGILFPTSGQPIIDPTLTPYIDIV
mgnify:CR=1 FL=1